MSHAPQNDLLVSYMHGTLFEALSNKEWMDEQTLHTGYGAAGVALMKEHIKTCLN